MFTVSGEIVFLVCDGEMLYLLGCFAFKDDFENESFAMSS
jgi:hypothetical protein